MRCILEAFKQAWSLGIRKLRIQSDYASAVAILSNSSSLYHQHVILAMQYQEICTSMGGYAQPYLPRSELCCVYKMARSPNQ
ncbi:hypothetical protein LINGRAHAP2_LOCUS17726 [Linum grandiflorum]